MVSKPALAQRLHRVDAAVVELDALADAVRAAAEDDDLLLVGRARLVVSDSYVEYRYGVCGDELGGAGVDALVDRHDAELLAMRADLLGVAPVSCGDAARSREAERACSSRSSSASSDASALPAQRLLALDDALRCCARNHGSILVML